MAKKVTVKESIQAHKKLTEYKKALNKANRQKAKAFKALNNALDEEIGKMIWENWYSEEELEAEIKSVPDYIWDDIISQYTEEEIENLKFPTRENVIDFYSKITKLCSAVGKEEAMNLLQEYCKKISKSKEEFSRDTWRYAGALYEFASKFKKNVFDTRLVRLWLYDPQQWELFTIGALNQSMHREYLFDKLALGLV